MSLHPYINHKSSLLSVNIIIRIYVSEKAESAYSLETLCSTLTNIRNIVFLQIEQNVNGEMQINDSDRSRTQNLCIYNHSLLCHNGLASYLVKINYM